MRARLAIVAIVFAGCPWPSRPPPGVQVPDSGVDGGGDADTDVDADADTDTDVDADCDDPFESDCNCGQLDNCIDVGDPDIVECSDVGMECRDIRDCQVGFTCIPDASGWSFGYCALAGCDPDAPRSCPVGSSCVYHGRDEEGVGYSNCLKDCNISDRNPWHLSSCGCRDGYECDLVHEVCVPGCTETTVEDDCCRYWADPDGDFIDDGAAEWDAVPNCVVTCNEDAYRCTNPGREEADFGDPCTFDQDCPEEGVCLRERDADGVEGGDHVFVGGYCTRYRCDLGGRRCGGDCRNLGSVDDPLWLCAAGCTVAADGADPWAVNEACGADYGCHPDTADPEAEENGFCWPPGSYNDVRERNVGGPCDDDADCWSPFGQGFCLEEQGGSGWLGGTCGLRACDFPGMEDECPGPDFVCESLGALGVCLDRCTAPGGGYGVAAGCRDDDYACYPSRAGGGAGVCFPSCTAQPDPARFCREFFVGAPSCNSDTGTCER